MKGSRAGGIGWAFALPQILKDQLNLFQPGHIAKVYYIEGYRNYDVWFLQTMFKIKILL